jgi:hypothetical protein
MKSRILTLTAIGSFVVIALFFSAVASGQAKDVLKAGSYTAKVKAIVCGGCGPLIVKTLQGMKGLESVSVDGEKMTVRFSVKKDASVQVADMQKALKAAADQMGMGADYTLSELKPAK